ncbi:uncharacterized protein F4822DRAFT_430375 [Hypoxylon trugodes]|uniref:uncharacterized protein n=1 Tax=Hypoxylon trugodes TaxID=326681 RepID=UPI002199787D|nr:uncharacterized protein F4822DRAFT_430375 [Hypoxylon trugodes]KAI1387628.1 hypothetical protein F4822DRAFT_430375 [Hypoxylon trugodes]
MKFMTTKDQGTSVRGRLQCSKQSVPIPKLLRLQWASASMLGGGPSSWRPFFQHIFDSAEARSTARQPVVPPLANTLNSMDDLDQWEAAWTYLTTRLSNLDEDNTISDRFDELQDFI